MKKYSIDLIVGARPNFVKCPVMYRKLKEASFNVKLIHTGQHYDKDMSDMFFEDLHIPKPDISLNVGSYPHAEQTAKIMIEYEKTLFKRDVDLVLVFGDVNSTIAAVLTAKKLHIKAGHIEAGLRSNDMSMPEEINRIATDSIADYLFAPSDDAVENLLKTGRNSCDISLVGNVMIDTLKDNFKKIEQYDVLSEYGLKQRDYYYLTLHRPSNVDSKKQFKRIIEFLNKIASVKKIVFPIHPRTLKMAEIYGLKREIGRNILLVPPVSYLKSLALEYRAKAVITDSGGIQEETSYLGVPCFTLRKSTERPITVKEGTNTLIEPDENALNMVLSAKKEKLCSIKYWDGKASERTVKYLKRKINL